MKRIRVKKSIKLFSDLEKDILDILWKRGGAGTGVLYKFLANKHNIKHSTIAVTLGRLYKRKILTRKSEKAQGGTRYIYYPRFTKEEISNQLVFKFVDFLSRTFGESSVANLRKKLKK